MPFGGQAVAPQQCVPKRRVCMCVCMCKILHLALSIHPSIHPSLAPALSYDSNPVRSRLGVQPPNKIAHECDGVCPPLGVEVGVVRLPWMTLGGGVPRGIPWKDPPPPGKGPSRIHAGDPWGGHPWGDPWGDLWGDPWADPRDIIFSPISGAPEMSLRICVKSTK